MNCRICNHKYGSFRPRCPICGTVRFMDKDINPKDDRLIFVAKARASKPVMMPIQNNCSNSSRIMRSVSPSWWN